MALFLLLSACTNNTEKMQSVNPLGSAAKLNDLSDEKDSIALSKQ